MKKGKRLLCIVMAIVICASAITPGKITSAKKKNTYYILVNQPSEDNKYIKIIGTKYLRLNVKCKKATSEKKALHLKNNNYRLKNKKFKVSSKCKVYYHEVSSTYSEPYKELIKTYKLNNMKYINSCSVILKIKNNTIISLSFYP